MEVEIRMRTFILLSLLIVLVAARRKPGDGQNGGSASSTAAPTAAPTTTAAPATTAEPTYGSVIAETNPGDAVASNSNCGDDAEGYYEEYTADDTRYIVVSGAPSHAAEYDQDHANPNTRCERWQYVAVPLEWSASGSDYQALGVIGYVMSGGTVYDHRSSPQGDLASYYEWFLWILALDIVTITINTITMLFPLNRAILLIPQLANILAT